MTARFIMAEYRLTRDGKTPSKCRKKRRSLKVSASAMHIVSMDDLSRGAFSEKPGVALYV